MAERFERRGSHDDGYAESRDEGSLRKSVVYVNETASHGDDVSEDADAEGEENRQDQKYPSKLQLMPILIGICLQSVCIALVSFPTSVVIMSEWGKLTKYLLS